MINKSKSMFDSYVHLTWSLLGFTHPIPMLVLLSCHYRDSVQASLQKQKTRAVSEGEGQSTGAELLSIGKRGTGDKYLSLTHDGLGSQRCWAENPAVGSCRVREEDIFFSLLTPLRGRCSVYQPRASLPAQGIPAQPQQHAHLCRHAPSHFVARHCRSLLKM